MAERSKKAGRTLGRIMIFFMLLILLPAVGGYYFITYRLKSSIQYAVRKASSNRYSFEAKEINLSLWNKTFSLKNASLVCLDTSNINAYYSVKVKDIYFSVSSLKALWNNKKLLIDSLSVIEPDITVRVKKKLVAEAKPDSFHTSKILDFLQSTLKKINAHSLEIKDAAFSYGLLNGPPPFHADHISIGFYNFTKVTVSDENILGSENITLSLGKQNWVIPDGHQRLVFKGLSFDGRARQFVLDSCTFYKDDPSYNGQMVVYADKFYFNSQHLPAIYKRNELLIDSLICINPTISLPSQYQKTAKTTDTAKAVNYIFNRIHFGFVEVRNGDITLNSSTGNSRQVATNRANLSIFNLNIDPAREQPLSTDSIKLDLNKIAFITPDSLYQLSIENFSFKDNNAIFRQVVFGPSPYKSVIKSIHFESPQLLVRNISLEDLMRKHIKANEAELLRPVITIIDRTTAARAGSNDDAPTAKKMDIFYQSLHAMSQLINVETFKLIEGEVHVKATDQKPVGLSITKINTRLLLNKLFLSDSLISIKESIPELRAGSVQVTTPKARVVLNNYYFEGTNRLSWIDKLALTLSNGNVIEGKKVFWQDFDWDTFQMTGGLKIALVRLGDLNITTKGNNDKAANSSANGLPKKPLPMIIIGKLETDNITFKSNGNTEINFSAKNLFANDIQTAGNIFTWDSVRTSVQGFAVAAKNIKTSAKEINFNNYAESFVKNISVESSNEKQSVTIGIPDTRVHSSLHSTDFSKLELNSIILDRPDINIVSRKLVNEPPLKAERKSQSSPDLTVAHIKIIRGNFSYTSITGSDTLKSKALADASFDLLHVNSDVISSISAAALHLSLANISFDKKDISVVSPSVSLALKDISLTRERAGKLNLNGVVALDWQQVAFHYNKDGSDIIVKDLTGNFHDNFTAFNPKDKLSWQKLVGKTSIDKGDLAYHGKKITASIENYSWQPPRRELLVNKFSVTPVIGREETFNAAPWQRDYITVKGETLRMRGVQFGDKSGESLIHVRNISVDNIDMNTSRDKAMPFQHGIEKPMPTKLISTIKLPVKVDTVELRNSFVTYHERSAKSGKWNDIFLTGINGYLFNINTRHENNDSLYLSVSANIFDNPIRNFSYAESYEDSLSSFTAHGQLSPFILTKFSQLSMPMASVAVMSGVTDTSYLFWAGNKHAAFGTMGLFYNDLKIKIYNKKDTTRRGFMPSLFTFAANLFIPTNHNTPTAIYAERDKEKFIFNYWVKAPTRGLLTTVRVKSNRKYRRQYIQKQKEYFLPPRTNDELKKTLKVK